ncbi:hypothetical protein [Qipengyuania sp. JC766]|uniref:hypothetical protein n=1 Tax=Qipengyuania sp. JC766 TaxID=3232139 RepID=UPI003457CCEA
MSKLIAILAVPVLALSAPSAAQPALDLEQQTALRCSAAFAIVAEMQARGEPAAAEYPQLGTRGREFFVRTSARLMDQAGLTRAQVTALLTREAEGLRTNDNLDEVMPACLLLLEASGIR